MCSPIEPSSPPALLGLAPSSRLAADGRGSTRCAEAPETEPHVSDFKSHSTSRTRLVDTFDINSIDVIEAMVGPHNYDTRGEGAVYLRNDNDTAVMLQKLSFRVTTHPPLPTPPPPAPAPPVAHGGVGAGEVREYDAMCIIFFVQ